MAIMFLMEQATKNIEERNRLQSLLENVHLFPDTDESLVWTPHKLREFFIKSLCVELAKNSKHPM